MIEETKGFLQNSMTLTPTGAFDASVRLIHNYGNGEGGSYEFELEPVAAFNVSPMDCQNTALFELGLACIKTALGNVKAIHANQREQAAQFKTAVRELSNECNLLRS